MESVWRSGSGPLCFSRVVPMPALVLLKLPDDSGHRCIRPSVAECQSVRVSASKADSGSPMQSKGERCPSPSHSPILALPDLVLGANSPPVSAPLGDSDQAGPAVPASGQDLASSTRALEVVVMAHTELDEVRLGRHRMVSAFMRGVRRLTTTRPMAVPSWDLSVILEGLVTAPFEPLESAPERILTLKVTLLLALTSLKRVGDLQALSVSEMCMDFAPGLVKVTLRSQGLVHIVSLSGGHASLFPSSSICFEWGWEASHALPGTVIEAVCGSLQSMEKILPIAGVFWCWLPRGCHVKAEDFSLGERRHFAGLWGAEPSFTS